MKKIVLVLLFSYSLLAFAQNQSIDSRFRFGQKSVKANQSIENKGNANPNSDNIIICDKQLLDNGYILIEQIHLWGSGSTWLNYEKINLIYDEKNKIVEKNIFSWDDFIWINSKREFYSYDDYGNDTMTLKQYWAVDRWINTGKIINTFDIDNHLIQTINQNFYDSLFINLDKRSFTYDVQNNLIEEIYQFWAGEIWDNRTRSTMGYNNNFVIETTNDDWNGFEWVKNNQRLYEYDENNNETLEVLNYWSGTNWDYHMRQISNYNSNNLITEFIWDEYFGNGWSHLEKNIYTYDTQNLIEDKKLHWETFEWDTSSRIIYFYNSNEKCIERSFQFYRNSGWEDWTRSIFEYDVFGNLSVESSYTWVFTEWVNNHRYINSYTQLTSTESVQTEKMYYFLQQNYPNPFNPSTTIQYAVSSTQFVTLKIYDLLGREVATLVNEEKPAGSYNVEFRMQNLELSSGIYFYQLKVSDPSTSSGQSFIETKKMILLK